MTRPPFAIELRFAVQRAPVTAALDAQFLLAPVPKWNDFREFYTSFAVRLLTARGERLTLGRVKILQRGHQRTELPLPCARLPDDFCSLGQTPEFYMKLASLEPELGRSVLDRLRDIASRPDIELAFQGEPGLQLSLLRFSRARAALRKGRELFTGAPASPAVEFRYRVKLDGFEAPHDLAFSFADNTSSLGRINVLVGKNGTGKTQFLAAFARALSGIEIEEGRLEPAPVVGPVLAVSYSALDTFTRPKSERGKRGLSRVYHYCGLRDGEGRIDLETAFAGFQDALHVIAGKRRRGHWLRLLEASGLLEGEHHLRTLLADDTGFLAAVRQLSAGHKLILFVLANLLAHIERRAVILFDEPELHLHPNMLSALMRALHELLDELDGFAIVATHSPIVVQEIPATHVYIIQRVGRIPRVVRYAELGESFGASLNEIIRFAFVTDEEQRNYVRLLRGLASHMSTSEIEALLGEDVPLGVRLLLKSLAAERDDASDPAPRQ